MATETCALCSLPLASYPIVDGNRMFCCMGCHAVFHILSSKNQIDGFSNHPIFLQALKSGLISNPQLIHQIQSQKAEIIASEREKLHLEISDMWCPSCAEIIRLMLLKEKGVINCVVDYSTDFASIEFSPRYISKEQIFELIRLLAYTPVDLNSKERKVVSTDLYLRFIVAAFCSINLMMLAYPLYATYFNYDGEGYGTLFTWLSLAISLPVIFYSAWPIWRRFITSLKVGLFGMETLVTIGVSAALIMSFHDILKGGTRVYFDSMSVVIVFVLLGKIIEAKAKFSAKESLMRLTRATPRRGRKVLSDGSTSFVLIKDICKGDTLVAYAGEKISVDGIVTDGEGACDESLMTGEAIPILKKVGERVLGGTILLQGRLFYQVGGSVEESALHKIIEMIERDIDHKSIYTRPADHIVRWFVPMILLIALTTASFYLLFDIADAGKTSTETAFLRAIAILLISCPCAIGIAAPTAESYLLNSLASLGAIVRNRGCLASLGKESVFVFDKTGTVTEGRFKVVSGLDALPENLLEAICGLSSQSTHPVASAIAAAALQGASRLMIFEHIEEVSGQGIRGLADGTRYLLGSASFMRAHGIHPPESTSVEQTGIFTHSYFVAGDRCIADICLGDCIRQEINEVIHSLKPSKTILLSGDTEAPVAAVAKACRFDEWHASYTPLQKRDFIESLRLKGETVCMIGDGINDAPALTASHIGISVVSATDMSIQVSDILLTTENLKVIPKLRALANKGRKIVKQNLFWAFFYNVIGIFLAAFGILSPIFAAFAMSISSVTVLFNATRIGRNDSR